MSRKILPIIFLILIFTISLLVVSDVYMFFKLKTNKNIATNINKISNGLTPSDISKNAKPAPTSLPSPSPSPRSLTFEEKNQLYGPCVNLPVIFYHHIQNMDVAKANGQQNLTVATDTFIKQMQYLKDKGYNTASTSVLTDFFDKSIPVPKNSIIITFDDGYEDFYVNVLPVIKQDGFKVVLALPTGLVGNPGYLTWDEISQGASNGIEIINHTWSHANMASGNTSVIQREITTADNQLNAQGYNKNKAFVYPYGGYSDYAMNFLKEKGYTLAFTTAPGATMCKKLRFSLPRIRIGNTNLSAYGF